jgi:aldose sugar dehydrogenase
VMATNYKRMRAGYALGLIAALPMLWATTAAKAEQTKAIDAAKTAIRIDTIAEGLVSPWSVAVLPDGRYLVTERPGRLRVVATDGTLSEPVSGIPAVAARNQGGLLDVVLSPDFAVSQEIYLSYSEPRGEVGNGTAVMRAKLVLNDKGGGALADTAVIFQQQPAAQSFHHFGSRIVFAPDGTLFVTLGDRAILRDEAQNPANQIGKIIRINRDGSAAAVNPKKDGWDPKIWSIGHRNVQGAALDPGTGQLWTTEHAAKGGDELNQPEAGKNYGWPVIVWGTDYDGSKIGEGTAKAGLEQPVYYWNPSIGLSGLTFYTGDKFPAWKGNILAGSLKGQHIDRLVLKDNAVVAHEKIMLGFNERIRDVRQAPDGSILVLTDNPRGRLLRLTPE